MAQTLANVLRYWRTSLADGALGEGTFRNSDLKRFLELPEDALVSGQLPKELVDTLFRGLDGSETVLVRFWPVVLKRISSHAASRADGMPEIVAPVVTEGFVDRAGRLVPTRSCIARDLLTPLPQGVFALGSVEALDNFLTATPLPENEAAEIWKNYSAHYLQMLNAVAPGWTSFKTEYLDQKYGFIEAFKGSSGTIRGILDVYDNLLENEPDTPLLRQLVSPQRPVSKMDRSIEEQFSRRLGHSNPNFPLAEEQRQVLAWLDAAKPGEVIAVNGPPGTGKTTMLLSAVAGLWVKAALEGGDPPIIVAASSNNQAVTNIINAFGRDFGAGTGVFGGRWLPEITNFGVFLPSHSLRAEAMRSYQTEAFQAQCETLAYFERARGAWLEAARTAFPDIKGDDAKIEVFVLRLRDRLTEEANKLRELDNASNLRRSCAELLISELGSSPEQERIRRADSLRTYKEELDRLNDTRTALDHYFATEPWLLGVFGFIPSIRRKRAIKARLFIGDRLAESQGITSVEEIESRVLNALKQAEQSLASANQLFARADNLMQQATASEVAWRKAVDAIGSSDELGDLERQADLVTRFNLFLLATHYWEGRWLMAMEADLGVITSSHTKNGRKSVQPRWRRRMMLTPCAVATFATLPGKLTCSRYVGDEFASDILYNFIDLLIVDEAGQVLPEVAGASFALAKKALVIGDTQQLEPISSVPGPVDIGNLKDNCLIDSDEVPEQLAESGIRSISGSAMRLAQQACNLAPWNELDRGLHLFEHRRCHDEIISFNNDLCYKGKLRPMRGPAPADAVLPAIGYLHVDGRAFPVGGSRNNPVEARTIAGWLQSNRTILEDRYSLRLEQIVGIVTPFGQQVRAIRAACAERGITVAGTGSMAIGTVHTLQGAERPIVIFSPVYSKHFDGGFIDAAPSMLNVTVSRAKDSFLVFGDLDILATARVGSPRSLLSEVLAAKGQALDFRMEPREDLTRDDSRIEILQHAVEHDAFLLDALKCGGQRYMIVSPWVVVRTMAQTGIISAMEAARRRGADIEVFVDPLLNTGPAADGLSQMEALERKLSTIGVNIKRVPKLHSKIVAVDSGLLCAGSFNWLSADRNGQYARHETSFVYRGPHVEGEIKIVRDGLMLRAK
jgi:hypothetical protein